MFFTRPQVHALQAALILSVGLFAAGCVPAAPAATPIAVLPTIATAAATVSISTATPFLVSGGAQPTGTLIANLPTTMPTVAPTTTPVPPQPTITSSGPMLPESQNNAIAFTTAVPQSAGPFTLVKDGMVLSPFGARLMYKTEDGQIYQVLLWITQSAQDSSDRYHIETDSVQSKQSLKLGDEGVYSMSDTHILAVIRYRNVVIDVYRPADPSGTVPLQKFTDDQVQTLLQQLFAALPAMP